MTDKSFLQGQLKQMIADRKVVGVIGAGVSAWTAAGHTVDGHNVALWPGLLRHGVDYCCSVQCDGADEDWRKNVLQFITNGKVGDLLRAADEIALKLEAPKGGYYAEWLYKTVGQLKVAKREIIQTLSKSGMGLMTTNYDNLVEEASGRPGVTWKDEAHVHRIAHEDSHAILHLHGHFLRPETIVLSSSSYDEIRGAKVAQGFLQAILMTRSVLFVGCGETFDDPNFSRLLEWMREILPTSPYDHYLLARQHEVEALRAKYRAKTHLQVLSYGDQYDELAPFLQELIPEEGPILVSQRSSAPPAAESCFGRDREIEIVLGRITADPSKPTVVLGPGGVGKSTVTIQALDREACKKRFEKRRYFVRCDGWKSDALPQSVTAALGLVIPPGAAPFQVVERHLSGAPSCLVLDNFEDPWNDHRENANSFLRALAEIPGLALVASLRGNEAPAFFKLSEAVKLDVLNPPQARELFLNSAGEHFGSDPRLDHWLSEVTGFLPLALKLLAQQAQGHAKLDEVIKRWNNDKTGLLRFVEPGATPAKLNTFDISIEFSIRSPRMSSEGLRLIRILALLPAGLSHIDLMNDLSDKLPWILPGVAALRNLGLVFDELERLRLLPPVRAYVLKNHPPEEQDREDLTEHFLNLAKELGPKVGREGGAEAIARLAPEWMNLETLIRERLHDPDPARIEEGIKNCLSLTDFIWLSGLGSKKLIEEAAQKSELSDNPSLAGELQLSLGTIALYSSDHEGAREHFEQALPLYRRVGSVLGEANCIKNLGEIALRRSDHVGARERYEQALPLYRRVGDVLGEANCIKSLGDIALRRSDHEGARERYKQALPLYRRVGDVLGEANCIKNLGGIALRRSDHEGARERFEQALPLYRRVGAVLGEAYCIKNLGNIALERSDHEGARERFEQALPLYRRVGNVLGEANCIRSLGDISVERSDHEGARKRYEEALGLYQRIQEPYSVGWTHIYLARIPRNKGERDRHLRAARDAWRSIKREDLIESHIHKAFPDAEL